MLKKGAITLILGLAVLMGGAKPAAAYVTYGASPLYSNFILYTPVPRYVAPPAHYTVTPHFAAHPSISRPTIRIQQPPTIYTPTVQLRSYGAYGY
jgi:hypothetical protein